MKLFIDVDLFEHGKHSHGIHCGDEATEQEVMEQRYILQLEDVHLAYPIEGEANPEDIPDCPHHCIQENRPDVLKEGAAGHEVAGIQDDGRKEVEEEDVAVHDRRGLVVEAIDDPPHDQSHKNQQAAFGDDRGQFFKYMETCQEEETKLLRNVQEKPNNNSMLSPHGHFRPRAWPTDGVLARKGWMKISPSR